MASRQYATWPKISISARSGLTASACQHFSL